MIHFLYGFATALAFVSFVMWLTDRLATASRPQDWHENVQRPSLDDLAARRARADRAAESLIAASGRREN